MVWVAVCDDERERAEALKAAWGEEREICCEINVCPSAETLWFAYEDNAYHILL